MTNRLVFTTNPRKLGISNREARDFHRYAVALGFSAARRGNRLIYRHPNVSQSVVAHLTVSDRRGYQNLKAQLRRVLRQAGLIA